MRVLYLVPYVPNLIRVRPYNFIRNLVALGHEVTVLTLESSEADGDDIAKLREICEVSAESHALAQSLFNCCKAVPSRDPLQVAFCWNQRLANRAMTAIRSGAFDVLHVEHLRGVRYAQYVKRHLPHFPVVWDSVDCISYLFGQAATKSHSRAGKLFSRLDLGRTRRFEAHITSQFDHTLVTSKLDKQAFEALSEPQARGQISVVTNGVDLPYFSFGQAERHPAKLVISGKMSYHANEAMVRFLMDDVMPLVWQTRPDVELSIVGKDPSAEIVKYGADDRVTVTGMVDDIRPYLWEATVAVAPIQYGAGIQNKVLEAMACGAPTVVTPKAVAALNSSDGAFLVGQNATEFSDQILSLLNNLDLAKSVQLTGRQFVENHHDWQQCTQKMVDVYRQAIADQQLVKSFENS